MHFADGRDEEMIFASVVLCQVLTFFSALEVLLFLIG